MSLLLYIYILSPFCVCREVCLGKELGERMYGVLPNIKFGVQGVHR